MRVTTVAMIPGGRMRLPTRRGARFGWLLGLWLSAVGLQPPPAGASTGDRYEPDDTRGQATAIWSVDPGTLPTGLPDALKDLGIPQVHDFHGGADEDWLAFHAAGDDWHEVHAWPQGSTLDLSVELYDDQGSCLKTADWNFEGEGEVLSYYLQGEARTLWVRVTPANTVGEGADTAYSVAVFQPYLEFDGFLYGLVSDAATGGALAGARVTSSRGSGVLTQSNGAYLMPHAAGRFDFTATTDAASLSHTVEIEALVYTERDFVLPSSATTANAGALTFAAAEFPVDEAAAGVALQVERRGGTSGAVRVDFATGDGSAEGEQDFTPTTGTLQWADGQGGSLSTTIPLTDDARYEGEESFRVSLEQAEGADLEGWSVATVSITDDDVRRPSLFDPATGELTLPDVVIGTSRLEAVLVREEGRFRVLSTIPASVEHEAPVSYSSQTLLADIPYVEVSGSEESYSAVLRLLDPSSLVFDLAELHSTPYVEIGF